MPCPEVATPNSSAAYATVCVKRVFVKAADIDAIAIKSTMRRWRRVSVSDGKAHVGRRIGGVLPFMGMAGAY
jgi:hypothetical protein